MKKKQRKTPAEGSEVVDSKDAQQQQEGREEDEEDEDPKENETFELLRVSPPERVVRTLREIVPHISGSLLGEELSSDILKRMNEYLGLKVPGNVIPFEVDQELEKVFVDGVLAKFPRKHGHRALHSPDTISADSEWELRTMLMLKSPEELEALVWHIY